MALTDSGNHPPATSGTYNYNATPNVYAGLTLGDTDTDPVFGETIKRFTDRGAEANTDNYYTFHAFNADGTLYFNWDGGLQIRNTSDGSVAYANQPTGNLAAYEIRWDMVDADKYYYPNSTSLMRRNLAAQTDTTMRNFTTESSGASLESMGGSVNYQSANGRYFIVQYNGTVKLWDSQTDTIYSGSVTPADTESGWTGITPSGNYIVTQDVQPRADPNTPHYAYPVNHGTTSIGATPNSYWGMGGSHGALISCSDNNDYGIIFENYGEGAVYACDLSQDIGDLTDAQQRAACIKLLDVGFAEVGPNGHFSAVSVGSNQDWVFVGLESETENDDFNQAVGTWEAYKQEIIAINVLTLAKRRLAHHRSRACGVYEHQPRVSCSPTGNRVLWVSNMNDSTPTGYADVYGIENPLGAASGGQSYRRGGGLASGGLG